MNGISTPIERRNQRISARLRRIQGQIVALERSLEKEPELLFSSKERPRLGEQ
jgi:hypothetical protein